MAMANAKEVAWNRAQAAQAAQQQQVQAAQQAPAGQVGQVADPYGSSSVSTQSMRRRGDTSQQRVGLDTRVRGDASSGTDGAGTGMADALTTPGEDTASQPVEGPSNGKLWEAARQPTDIASVQARVLANLDKLRGGA